MEGKKVFGIHMQDKNSAHSEERPHICIGWPTISDLSKIASKDELFRVYNEKYPGKPKQHVSQNVGQIWRFYKEASIGDYVVHKQGDIVYIGEITSDYYLDMAMPEQTPDYRHNRDVRWIARFHKAVFSEKLLNSLGSAMSFFSLDPFLPQIQSLLSGEYLQNVPAYTFLKELEDIDPDTYDGSFELLRTIAKAYDGVPVESLDYSDLEVFYLGTIGTWKSTFDNKRAHVETSHLPAEKKASLISLLNDLERRTIAGEFSHFEHENKTEMGMFGAPKMSMSNIQREDAQDLIKLFVKVAFAQTDEEAIALVSNSIEKEIKDFKAGKLSTILFCIRPTVFPIMNGNQGIGSNVYESLGIPLKDGNLLTAYANNCKEIKAFRDKHFRFKNYRVFDLAANLTKKVDADGLDLPEPTNFWMLVANPGIWSIEDMADGDEQNYTFLSDNGHPRQKPKNFRAAMVGDVFIGFEGAPKKEFLSYGVISRIVPDERIYFKKLGNFANRVSKDEVLSDPAFDDLDGKPQFQGSLFRLTKEQYERLMELGSGAAPHTEITPVNQIEPYSVEDFFNEVYVGEDFYGRVSTMLRTRKNIILQGPPGVGKTFAAKRLAYAIMGQKDESRIGFVQFHQSYSYEDFVQGYKPTPEGGFKLQNGVFYEFCEKARKNPGKDYFFIIDEINRGNISRIFGELLMLIEDSHRGEAVKLAYADKNDNTFSVPSNIYIIGMMNTADRSLALLDYALRRRFAFIPMEPAFQSGEDNAFAQYLSSLNWEKLAGVIACVKELNEAISKTLGIGFMIGHSYFSKFEEPNDEQLSLIVEYEIIPTVEEYFVDDDKKRKEWVDKLRNVIA